jgi:hypothetical protein
MKRIIRRCFISVGIGTLFPVAYLSCYSAGLVREFPLPWGLYLWPTSILLMATAGRESDYSWVAEVIGISLVSNAAIWLLLGLLCFRLFDLWRTARLSSFKSHSSADE